MLYLFQLEGLKQYPCEYCSKVCKSKGGRTKHIRSKYDVEANYNASSVISDLNVENHLELEPIACLT